MRRASLCVVLGSLCVGVLGAADKKPKSELRGDWEGVEAQTKGKKGSLIGTWQFKDDVILIPGGEGKQLKWKYAIGPKTDPRQIDLTPGGGPAAGKKLKGIYRIDKDTLTICHVRPDAEDLEKKERPSSFDPAQRNDTVVLTFERKKP